jgi:Zn-dependent protease
MNKLFFYLVLIPSAIIHEYMHGFVADRLGDPTARNAGRLTLDPRVHIDMWGTILLPLILVLMTNGSFVFGYAKPVPYDPNNLRNKKRDPMLVSIAGPLSNLTLAFVFGLIIRYTGASPEIDALLAIIVYVNVLLAVFNLVPIPPLDGSKVLFAILPDSMWQFRQLLERYGVYILLIFILFFFQLLSPIIGALFSFFVGGGLML